MNINELSIDTEFLTAARNGNISRVKQLHEQGVDIHKEMEAALRTSSKNGHLEVVEFLVEHGADVHIEDDDPIAWSATCGHVDVTMYLIEKGADINKAKKWGSQDIIATIRRKELFDKLQKFVPINKTPDSKKLKI